MFSKVYRKEEIERIRLKKQLINKTANIEIKKMTLVGKEEKERKKVLMYEKDKKTSSISAMKKKMERTLLDYDNFEIAGW